jgi:hypothetical protein
LSYRLRRVIGINIRNPRDEGPSLRIAELDTRGAVIAAGRNGVGKTSFLRLIPLFYGATPTRILRGSGLTTMIRYMLPHASSAVAFEYERSSSEDLRCAVMHCRPDEDVPQFHILRGGFEEKFFYDESGTFVTREDFKARVERFGIPVEQKLTLSDYRSVILNERATTKNAVALRNLAAAHSLGPTGTTLQGLDHIAAAMGNEKISFRDLQDIVVERITSSISDEAGKHTTREIKKGARDVSSWLTDLQHLRDLKAKQPQSEELSRACANVQKTELTLRELRSAVKNLVASNADEKLTLTREKQRVVNDGQELADKLKEAIDAASQARDEAKNHHEALSESVKKTEDRQRHFQGIGVETLVSEADQETQLKADQRRLDEELEGLKRAAAGIEESHEKSLSKLAQSVSLELTQIMEERTTVHQEARAGLEEIDAAEEGAREGLAPPARLLELPDEISKLSMHIGELKAEEGNPKLEPKMVKALEGISQSLRKARQAEREARKASDAAMAREDECAKELRRAQDSHSSSRSMVEDLRRRLLEAEADATPPAGSLHEFLRSSKSEGLGDIAKVLSPSMVKRTDLSPTEVPDAHASVGGIVTVGSVAVDVNRVALPEWFDLKDAQARVASVRAQLDKASTEFSKLERSLRDANAEHEAAEQQRIVTGSELDNRRTDVESLELGEQNLKREQEEHIANERVRLAAEVTQAQVKLKNLGIEKERLEEEHRQVEKRLRAGFNQQRGSIREREKTNLDRLKASEDNLRKREAYDRENLETERREGLSAAGVDTTKVEQLEGSLDEVQRRLRAIAEHRHEVSSWKDFSRGPLARLDSERELAKQAQEKYSHTRTSLTTAENALELHVKETDLAIQKLGNQIRQNELDATTLQELLELQLAAIPDLLTGHVVRPWAVEEIATEVPKRRSELTRAVSQVENLYQGLRSLMRRYEGQVSDWLTQAEAALPSFDGWPDHEVMRQKGLMICQWFERDYVAAVNSLHQDLGGILSLAASFVRDMDLFERQVNSFNHGLQKALKTVSGFDNFRDLQVEVRSSVSKLDYIKTLQQMQDMSDSRVSLMRGLSAHMARELELPGTEVDPVIRSFRDFLQREGGISVNLADQVRLECSLTINKSRVIISSEEEFKARASNGNSALIVAMFLMGFAQMVRKDSPVRITWVTDEIGRFDSGNVAAFLETLDTNHIDVISAAPQADPSMLYLFDRHCIFRKDGSIWEEREAQETLHAH